MKNNFWGDIVGVIKVKENIPDKNMGILRELYPEVEIIKEGFVDKNLKEAYSTLVNTFYAYGSKPTEISNKGKKLAA